MEADIIPYLENQNTVFLEKNSFFDWKTIKFQFLMIKTEEMNGFLKNW